jgi:hypothetical protein
MSTTTTTSKPSADGLDEQWDLVHDDRLGVGLRLELLGSGADPGVDDRFEPAPGRFVGEHQLGERRPVHRAVRREHARPELVEQGSVAISSGFDDFVGQPVRVDDHGTTGG